ncbi:hypothetical protein ACN28C_27860 [Plantactinospora sp. WMMC1484]|uniref:hypothetical protein n=1 Tax=Plantactinospora sp. WMMC1484 TaxID=3404122 RepID=UPI003BF55391
MRRLIGWSLRANRLNGDADKILKSGKEFARLFRRDGEPPLAPSQITRWERGEVAVTRATIRRYEQMLDLRPDSLVSVCDAIRRAESVTFRPPRSKVDHDRLHDLLDLAVGGAPMSGLLWMEFAEHVANRPDLMLHPREQWLIVVGRLLNELVVADHEEWLLEAGGNQSTAGTRDRKQVRGSALCRARLRLALSSRPGTDVVVERNQPPFRQSVRS